MAVSKQELQIRSRHETCRECGAQIVWYANDHNRMKEVPRFRMCSACCFIRLRPVAAMQKHLRVVK